MIFAVFSLMEETIMKPVETYAPFYFVWKIVFLLWCYMPQTNGADLVYTEFVGPKLRELEDKLAGRVKQD
jgi:receptor expression-enhancing protein 5/6